MPHVLLAVVLCRLQVAGITEEAALYDQHQAAKAAALAVFVDAAMGEPELVKEFEKRLEKGGRASAAHHTPWLHCERAQGQALVDHCLDVADAAEQAQAIAQMNVSA